jgi:hypothetical protein
MALLLLVLFLDFPARLHRQIFSGPSTPFEQVLVAMKLLDSKGVKILQEFPAPVEASDPTCVIDQKLSDTNSGSTVRVVTLSPAQSLQPCQQSRGVAAPSLTQSHCSGGFSMRCVPHSDHILGSCQAGRCCWQEAGTSSLPKA